MHVHRKDHGLTPAADIAAALQQERPVAMNTEMPDRTAKAVITLTHDQKHAHGDQHKGRRGIDSPLY